MTFPDIFPEHWNTGNLGLIIKYLCVNKFYRSKHDRQYKGLGQAVSHYKQIWCNTEISSKKKKKKIMTISSHCSRYVQNYKTIAFIYHIMMHIWTRPTNRRTDTNLYPPERQLTKASEPSFGLEGGARSNLNTSKDSQPMISYNLVSHWKLLGSIISKL